MVLPYCSNLHHSNPAGALSWYLSLFRFWAVAIPVEAASESISSSASLSASSIFYFPQPPRARALGRSKTCLPCLGFLFLQGEGVTEFNLLYSVRGMYNALAASSMCPSYCGSTSSIPYGASCFLVLHTVSAFRPMSPSSSMIQPSLYTRSIFFSPAFSITLLTTPT